jgi:glutathione S-transferase
MKGEGEPDEDKVASFEKQLNTNLDVYEKILSKQPYLAGDVSYKNSRIRFRVVF